MNFAASFFRPFDDRLMKVLKEGMTAQKLRLNIELAKIMVNERKFWMIDIHEVGEEASDGESKSKQKNLNSIDDSDDERNQSMASRLMKTVGQ